MKITFRLNAAQQSRGDHCVSRSSANADESNCVWVGNVAGWVWDHTSFNHNQDLSLEGDRLTYKGERCPFLFDGLYELVKEILGDDPVKIVEYVTSDARLRWDENLDAFLWNRADWDTYCFHNKGKTGEIPKRFTEPCRIKFLLKEGREKAAYAEFPNQLVREVKNFIRASE